MPTLTRGFKGFVWVLLCELLVYAIRVTAVWQVNLISDIHYDPLYGQAGAFSHCTTNLSAALGESGCDSPKALMDSMASDVAQQKSNFSLYAGDWQRHKFNERLNASKLFTDMKKSMSSITTGNLLPNKTFVSAWGNNDMVPDYYFDVSKREHKHLIERIKILNNSLFSKEEAETMIKCAFFARRLEGVTFVSLHSLIWSTSLQPPLADDVADPCSQFAFLEEELKFARSNHRKVIIIAHIPPSLNVYTVIWNGKFTSASEDMYWKESYFTRYINLMSTYKDVVSTQIFGHLHLFYFLCFPGIGSPAFILPSISPIYGNVPSYLLSLFSASWELVDLNQRSLINGEWRSTTHVTRALGLADGFNNLSSSRERIKDLYTNNVLWNNYLKLHNGGQATEWVFPHINSTSYSRAVIVCAMLSGTYDDIKECVGKMMVIAEADSNSSTKWKSIFYILLLIIVAINIGYFITWIISTAAKRFSQNASGRFTSPEVSSAVIVMNFESQGKNLKA